MESIRFKTRGMALRRALFILCAAILLFVVKGNAQMTGTANVQGTVTDSAGVVISGASVSAANKATHVNHEIKSSASGNYAFSKIPIDTYNARVRRGQTLGSS